jgi:hypothetical protein
MIPVIYSNNYTNTIYAGNWYDVYTAVPRGMAIKQIRIIIYVSEVWSNSVKTESVN